MTDADDATLGRLLAEIPRVRALARVLAAGDVDDAEQQIWVQALEHGAAPVRRPRAWLLAAVHNAARNLRRSERSRRQRELVVAREEAGVPSSSELMEREERRRWLVAAVDALPRVQRAVVLLRFFDELPPRAIAARLGLPVSTVWSRLRNALLALRQRLDREHGDRRAWLLPLVAAGPAAPPLAPVAPAAPPTRWLASALAAKVAIAVAGALLAAFWIGGGFAGAPERADLAAVPGAGGPVEAPAALPAAPTPAAERRAAAPMPDTTAAASPAAANDAARTAAGSLIVQVVQAFDGGPGAGVAMLLRPVGGDPRLSTIRRRTDAAGTARWDDLPVGGYTLTDDRHGDDEHLRITAGAPTEARYRLRQGLRVRGIVVAADGVPVEGALVEVATRATDVDAEVLATTNRAGRFEILDAPCQCAIGARAAGFAATDLQVLMAEPGADTEVRLVLHSPGGVVDGFVVDPAGRPVEGALVCVGTGRTSGLGLGFGGVVPRIAALVRSGAEGTFRAVGVAPGDQPVVATAVGTAPWRGACRVLAHASVSVRIELGAGGSLRGTVRDDAGAPVPDAEVCWGDRGDLGCREGRTATDGSFALDGLPSGDVEIRVRHRTAGRATVTVPLASGAIAVRDIVLQRGRVLRGRVLGVGGELALVQAFAEPDAAGRSWSQMARLDADGRFEIVGCPAEGLLTISFRASGFETVERAGIDPDDGPVELRAVPEAPRTARIRGVVEAPDGRPLANVQVFGICSYQAQRSGIVTTDLAGKFELGPLAAGTWRLVLQAADHPAAFVDGVVAVGGDAVEVPTVRLQAGGRAEVVLDEDAPGARLFVIEPDERDYLTVPAKPPFTTRSLPAGNYRLVVTGEGVALRSLPFAIRDGEITHVVVPAVTAVPVRVVTELPADADLADGVRLRITRDGELVGRAGTKVRRGETAVIDTLLAPGRYQVDATCGALRRQFALDVGPTPSAPVRIEWQ